MSDTLQNKYRTGDLAGTKERTYRLGSVANGQNGGFFQYNRYFLSHRPHTIDEIRISATEQLVTETHTHRLSRRRREKPKTCGKGWLARTPTHTAN